MLTGLHSRGNHFYRAKYLGQLNYKNLQLTLMKTSGEFFFLELHIKKYMFYDCK